MKLYRYFGTHADVTLAEGRLMVAKPTSLNDPFEFCFAADRTLTKIEADKLVRELKYSKEMFEQFRQNNPKIKSKKTYRRALKQNHEDFVAMIKREYPKFPIFSSKYPAELMDQFFRLCSFSGEDTKPMNEIVLWSHYANKHSGVRIGFDFDDAVAYPYVIRKVIYSPDRIRLKPGNGLQNFFDKTTLENIVRTKSEGWAYENEFRLLVTPIACAKDIQGGVERSYLSFSAESVFSVDLGIKCSAKMEADILETVKTKYPACTVRKAFQHPDSFSLNYECVFSPGKSRNTGSR